MLRWCYLRAPHALDFDSTLSAANKSVIRRLQTQRKKNTFNNKCEEQEDDDDDDKERRTWQCWLCARRSHQVQTRRQPQPWPDRALTTTAKARARRPFPCLAPAWQPRRRQWCCSSYWQAVYSDIDESIYIRVEVRIELCTWTTYFSTAKPSNNSIGLLRMSRIFSKAGRLVGSFAQHNLCK